MESGFNTMGAGEGVSASTVTVGFDEEVNSASYNVW